ncbi:diaminopimelate decarboxylase [Paractinoplanes abujensis]|uniref:Diaminopimelate decarboxylase n=1 Tax=Paractinoplanes abujensis TaxID=882441 RepID=A0A7W7G3R4_9ACTN|nr:type III PLP-dependent enzyme [Actinoplanes abujensis]MBB4693041.1 diaminopimelate decarboxylase [Actinoplanes abujensis]GID24941.1 diaminopimelate decarboxylase [Actinoplanes abujensis]
MSLDQDFAEQLAKSYGTPLFVYDLDEVEAARDELLGALPEEFELFFAVKANSHPELIRTLRGTPEHGCRTEISSTGELAVSIAAGHDPGDILYTGPGKTHGELDVAIGAGVRMFSVESLSDLRHIGAAAQRQGVVAQALLRINHVAASATTSIRMTGTPSQFGIDSETLADVLPELRAVAGTELAGFHFFPLSNARDEESLIGEFRNTIEVAAQLAEEHDLPVRFLDIGGGFSVPYAVPGPRASYPKLRAELAAILDLHFPGWRTGAPTVACESGRYLIGASGTLITQVTNIKQSRGRNFVIADAGINTFGGMSGLGRLLPVAVQTDLEPAQKASLVGPLCTPGDVLGREIALPDLSEGDIVTIPNAGAYGPTASLLMFLGRPAPAEIVVRGTEVVSVSRIEHERTWTVGTGPSVRM